MYGQFEPLKGNTTEINIGINNVSNYEHVPKVKWYILTIKEFTRCIQDYIFFKIYHHVWSYKWHKIKISGLIHLMSFEESMIK